MVDYKGLNLIVIAALFAWPTLGHNKYCLANSDNDDHNLVSRNKKHQVQNTI